ncbi:hypothetical protein ACJIZ3_018441 [Penstemon smallii]|uniref:DNA (cytosine-5-)-methyltransferase n=1 Tax=Penstemon smallii TaxID=265156 RepID=A0ABD3SYG4_9LAMI
MGTMSNESDSMDWNTEDDLEIDNMVSSPCSNGEVVASSWAIGSSSCAIKSTLIDQFLEMGFPEHLVIKALKENEDRTSEDAVLGSILTYMALEDPSHNNECTPDNPSSAGTSLNYTDLEFDLSDDKDSERKVPSSEKDMQLALLLEMGYEAEEALAAINRCGTDTPTEELIQFIAAARFRHNLDKKIDSTSRNHMKQKLKRNQEYKEHHGTEEQDDDEDIVTHLPKPMIGFGVPNLPFSGPRRNIPPVAIGPPYFYYENVALTPRGVWPKIQRFLNDIKPEFVDSQYFGAACRKRGYVHNLPIQNRFRLLPSPPGTIQEAFPLSRRWWPSWDKRTKLNCLVTCIGSAKLADRIKKAIEQNCNDNEEPPPHVKKIVLEQCKKWNLIWVGRNKVAPLEPDEMEDLMGFPKNHTRGGGISKTDRHKFLGNSFHVDTVAYHLSVLKNMYPGGINVLSLFSGIGGAEVALHRLGIPLNNVVSVEISEQCRSIVDGWWRETGQRGNLIHVQDVQEVDEQMLEQWISRFGGFDLVIGGSPCNNLAGGNRVSRDGLDGKHSSLFYEYYRILECVKSIMRDQ